METDEVIKLVDNIYKVSVRAATFNYIHCPVGLYLCAPCTVDLAENVISRHFLYPHSRVEQEKKINLVCIE